MSNYKIYVLYVIFLLNIQTFLLSSSVPKLHQDPKIWIEKIKDWFDYCMKHKYLRLHERAVFIEVTSTQLTSLSIPNIDSDNLEEEIKAIHEKAIAATNACFCTRMPEIIVPGYGTYDLQKIINLSPRPLQIDFIFRQSAPCSTEIET